MSYSLPVVCEAVQFSLLLRPAVSAHETMSHAPLHYLFHIKQNMTSQEKLILNFASFDHLIKKNNTKGSTFQSLENHRWRVVQLSLVASKMTVKTN